MNEDVTQHMRVLFATPLGTFRLDGTEKLNADLATAIADRTSDKYRNPTPSQQIQNEVFESTFDLFSWASPPIEELFQVVMAYLGRVIAAVNDYGPDEMGRMSVFNESWFHVTRRGGYVQPHIHPNASWSVVYCVREGEKDPGHEDSGALVLHSPRMTAAMHSDPANLRPMPKFANDAIKLHLKAGDLVVFPSDIMHSVSPYVGDGDRITIAANFWFGAKEGEHDFWFKDRPQEHPENP